MEEAGQITNAISSVSNTSSRPTSKSSSSYTLHSHKEEDEDDLVCLMFFLFENNLL